MAYPHEIRLRGPWEYEPLARLRRTADGETRELSGELPGPGRMELPGHWGAAVGEDFCGRVRFLRRFAQPTQLDPHERVWVVCEGVDAYGSMALNGDELGPIAGYAVPASFEITDLLDPRNELYLTVELPEVEPGGPRPLRPGRESLPGGPIGVVRLEVRERQFLDRLAVEVAESDDGVRLHVSGIVGGEVSDEKFEVLVTGWGGELVCHEVHASEPFRLEQPIERLSRWAPQAGDALGGLATLAVRLLRDGQRVWETELATAHRPLHWDTERQALVVGDEEHELPVDVLEVPRPFSVAELLRARQEQPQGLLLCRQILSEADYRQFDRIGWSLIQAVPVAWAEAVCSRLAHHPSIVAWCAPSAELHELPEEVRPRRPGCRPWISSEIATVRDE